MPKVEEIAQSAATIAHELGINKYDIYGSSVDDTSVEVFQGEPKQVQASNRSSVIVRVWNQDHQVGVTSTTDVDPSGLKLALKTAYEASFFGVKENVPDFSPQAKEPTANLPQNDAVLAPVSELIEKLIDAEKTVIDAHPAIESVPYNGLGQQDGNRFYLNSGGALREETRAYTSIYLYTKTEQDGKKPRSAGAFKISHSLPELDINGCITEAVSKTISHLDYQPIKTGKYRVVFSPRAFLSLFGRFSNLFNAQSILDKQSLSTPESLGTQIASSYLSVDDNALHPDNISAETFDGEGTPTRKITLISQGILTNFLHSTITAKRMNAEPTGHGSIGAKVGVSSHFYHVYAAKAANQTYRLEDAENVIYIDNLQALHAGVNSLQGSFSLPFDGWLVNKGEYTSIDSATVAGDFLSLLKSIIFVESEAEITPSGICPRIWIEELSITGS
ncbi:TldD/PmbA family protein [Chroococcus sp. FPU101]|uniref:TldD/PmbA family protein n=1 Tax=Chroococcus sp. FPU101 TaxID=1974212 RepID=UPI001A8DE6CB|nr:TldD/PmbA family protein [Chroococcus sp. FPU101]GFE70615.1 peptidase U62 modulator of DNA gyrase [Chroococcus sp. FPU101]